MISQNGWTAWISLKHQGGPHLDSQRRNFLRKKPRPNFPVHLFQNPRARVVSGFFPSRSQIPRSFFFHQNPRNPSNSGNLLPNSMASEPSDRKTRLYHPYQDLEIPIQNLYNLPTSPEFLFHEEAAVQRRSWGENLQYYTGCGYLTGAIVGGAKGSIEGLRSAEPSDTMKLRINRVLNSSGHTGRSLGNSLGAVGLIFAGLESGLVATRGTDDLLNSVLAGLGTGALYRAASGVRSAAVAGAIGGLAAGVAVAGKQAIKRYIPI